jgi:hypothetical protein
MRTGSMLVHMHGRSQNGDCWFVSPGGAVNDEVAGKITNYPGVVRQKDGLFPQHDQTWRFQSLSETATSSHLPCSGIADQQSGPGE